ncbi:MAG: LacI family transcriptional regulator [Spirochaetes bacterium]|nr:MAG: LacI family transcriptional regulator [Spirochaetota bacterium]
MPTRLKDLAKETGYSVSTISRALLGYKDVNAETRRRIVKAAQKHDYYPYQSARQLRAGKTYIIGFLIPTYGLRFSDPFFIELLTGIGDGAAAKNYDVLVGTSPEGEGELEAYKRIVAGGRVDGVVITRTKEDDKRVDYLLKVHTPFVLLGRVFNKPNVPYIDIDSKNGIKLLTEHLLKLGHRKIGFITSPEELVFSRYRNEGYREALKKYGIKYDASIVKIGDLTQETGRKLATELFRQKNRPSAVVCANDLTALGVYSAAHQVGLEIGSDISISGYDGISLAENAHPPLTTIQVPIYEVGIKLFNMLYKLLNNEPLENKQILLPPQPIYRNSTGPPRKADGH